LHKGRVKSTKRIPYIREELKVPKGFLTYKVKLNADVARKRSK